MVASPLQPDGRRMSGDNVLSLFGDERARPIPEAPVPVRDERDPDAMASGYASGRDQRGRPHLARQPCRSCHAPMLWVAMPSGKRNPLDEQPDRLGNVLLVEHTNDAGEAWRLGVVLHNPDLLDELRELGVPLYRSHFATCPDSDEHRREERRERKDLA
jgi:hypothetical protein